MDDNFTLLRRLARDKSGNTIAIMAAALVPMLGFAGSAVDMARLYVVKARLQQACDAGVLAGRKFMATSASTTLDTAASTQATAFFNNNFASGWMGTTAVTFTPTKSSDSQVAGTASATVPMTIMKLFGFSTTPLNVVCEARYDVADVDIMFVLDTTGSMACLPADIDTTCSAYVNAAGTTAYTRPSDGSAGNSSTAGYPGSSGYYVPEKSGSRISAVRTAVLDFFDTLASTADASTNIRYGFVTYTSTVNAGKAIQSVNPQYMVGGAGNATNTVSYQSRYIDPTTTSQYQVSTSSAYDATAQASCNTTTRTPAATGAQPYTFDTSSRATVVTKAWNAAQSGSNKCLVTTTVYGPIWTYAPVAWDVSSYLTQASVDDPSKLDNTTSAWQGCIEERGTTGGTTSFTTSSLPSDLDPDLVPTSDATRWRPMWPQVMYGRNYNGSTYLYSSTASAKNTSSPTDDSDATAYNSNTASFNLWYYGSGSLMKSGWSSCGKPVKRLGTMTRSQVSTYVNADDFRPMGGTYHDTGMIWGTRMLSPNGVFGTDTAAWSGRQAPNRVIVFLTDGDMAPAMSIYGMYGSEFFDQRVTAGDYANQKAYHNARFLAECQKAKALNMNVWTVSIAPAVTTEMQQCASKTSQALYTTSGSDLRDKFQAIAKAVALLRVSR